MPSTASCDFLLRIVQENFEFETGTVSIVVQSHPIKKGWTIIDFVLLLYEDDNRFTTPILKPFEIPQFIIHNGCRNFLLYPPQEIGDWLGKCKHDILATVKPTEPIISRPLNVVMKCIYPECCIIELSEYQLPKYLTLSRFSLCVTRSGGKTTKKQWDYPTLFPFYSRTGFEPIAVPLPKDCYDIIMMKGCNAYIQVYVTYVDESPPVPTLDPTPDDESPPVLTLDLTPDDILVSPNKKIKQEEQNVMRRSARVQDKIKQEEKNVMRRSARLQDKNQI